MRKHHCGSQDGWAGLDGAAQEDRVLRAAAVGVKCLRRDDCQQVMLFLRGVMVVHLPSAYPEELG